MHLQLEEKCRVEEAEEDGDLRSALADECKKRRDLELKLDRYRNLRLEEFDTLRDELVGKKELFEVG